MTLKVWEILCKVGRKIIYNLFRGIQHIQNWQTWLCMDAVIPSPSLISTMLWSNFVWSSPFFLPKLFLFSVLQCLLKRLRDLAIVVPRSVPRFIKNCFPQVWFLSYLIGTWFLPCLTIRGRYLLQWLNFIFKVESCWVEGCSVEDGRKIGPACPIPGKTNQLSKNSTPRMPCRTWILSG